MLINPCYKPILPILVGSRALNFWCPEIKVNEGSEGNEGTDWDLICNETHVFNFSNVERHNVDSLNNLAMTDYISSEQITLPDGQKASIMNLTGLAIMKRSHLWRDLKFDRHIAMYLHAGLDKEIKMIQNDPIRYAKELFDLNNRIKLTVQEYPQGHPNLMQSKEDFFDDAVKKKYDHDLLHDLVAKSSFDDVPVYTHLLKYEGMAYCCKDKWEALDYSMKIRAVLEEATVIAIERFMIPNDWQYIEKKAMLKALQKICTTLCSGWFRDFSIDSYKECLEGLYKMQKEGIMLKVKEALGES